MNKNYNQREYVKIKFDIIQTYYKSIVCVRFQIY
jgi:hypothetical protein